MRKIKLFLLWLLLSSNCLFSQQAWLPKGDWIEGEGFNDHSGHSIQISGDGNRLVIGAPQNIGGGNIINSYGHVRVFEWNGDSWKQMDGDFDGESNNKLGKILSISQDGNVIALGTNPVKIKKWNGSSWESYGSNNINISFNTNTDFNNITLNCDGSVIAISDPSNNGDSLTKSNSGKVSVYELLNDKWELKGFNIYGDEAQNWSGTSLSLDCKGERIAIGATGHSENGHKSGQIRVFQYSNNSWKLLGNEILGDAKDDYAGTALALNDSGDFLVFGAPSFLSGGIDKEGYVAVYNFQDSSWSRVGHNISSGVRGSLFGKSVDISSNGKRIIVGAQYGKPNGIKSGFAKVYELDSIEKWMPIFSLNGENIDDFCGKSVSISNNGKVSAISVSEGSGFFSNSGIVKVFASNTNMSLNAKSQHQNSTVYPNPTNGQIIIKTIDFEKVDVFDARGCLILSSKLSSISIKDKPSGFYLIKVQTKANIEVIKVLKH